MNVQQQLTLGGAHLIEIGEATWDSTDSSIRNRYPTATGGFSPRSSGEVPMRDLVLMTTFAAKHDQLSASECAEMIEDLVASIKRQHPQARADI
jgi:hypothetical protein